MLLIRLSYHSKKIAFFFAYLFLVSGLSGYAYGNSSSPGPAKYYHYYTGNDKKAPAPFHINVENKTGNKPGDKIKNGGKKELKKKQAGKKVDIGGPTQPEMTAFKPVGADNMADPFTGDFSYNIPLLDVGGYPVNIFYNSGITMDQEASWVGLGWNINPGTIMRNMRGLPDDFNGNDVITKKQYTRPDKTIGVNVGGRVEVFGGALGISINGGIFSNNMRGLGLEAGINPSISVGGQSGDGKTAPLSFGWKLSANSQSGGSSTFNISLSNNNSKGLNGSLSASIGTHSRQGLQALHLDAEVKLMTNASKSQNGYSAANGNFAVNPTIGTSINFAYPSFTPSMRSRTSSQNYDLDLGFGGSLWGVYGHVRLGGYFTQRWIKDEDIEIKQPAYGMLYMQPGQKDKNALMDFNRLNEGVYTPGTPAISVPVYTYDVYSISGEGTGGSFRAYRGDLGYVQDSYLENNGHSGHLGIELGAGSYAHGAINANVVLTPSSSGGWDRGNLAKPPMESKTPLRDYQPVYFKNPGEKAIPDIAYQDAIGGEDLVRLKMTNTGFGSPTLVPSFLRYSDMLQRKDDLTINTSTTLKKRDKRTQVISVLTAEEASRVGLNKMIRFTKLNEADSSQVVFGCSNTSRDSLNRFAPGRDAIRKKHHISEIDVLMQDGRRYVYDIPVCNTYQVDVTFNKTGSGSGNGPNNAITGYTHGIDNETKQNTTGKEYYVEKQEMPPYAHSYLLTGLLSPNYVDVKGDGITEDDMGDAIKFNYSKSATDLKWRTPVGSATATLSEGLKTDKDDDKAHYIYGERETWYLYSIESKNMVARFYVRNDRKDSRAVQGENGAIDPNSGAFRLSKISLFTKGELLKNPSKPKPVKTVHFEYDYSLCKNAPGSITGYGKLTLRSIYFTYNGNNKTKKNFYRFNYPTGNNPDYSFTANDRWGNYKQDNQNPGSLSNADFPYTDRDTVKTNEYVKAWTMNQVILPSGAAINVEYESDDYAFVQDRRAANMVTIAGFGTTPAPSVYSPKLYDGVDDNYNHIYINVPKAITATTVSAIKSQIQEWYLGNMNKSRQIYMKLAVQVPPDARGSGYELIPVYAEIEEFGLVPNTGGQKIFIRVKKLLSGYTPMVHYALQFLKGSLPSKAYPGYDVSESGGLSAMVKAMGGLFHSFKEVFGGGIKLMIKENKCRYTELDKSFIRLTDPYLKKPGGGLRVKKVVINDNWDKMTRSNPSATNGMANATYGQEYFYTKKELVNGELLTISSGVASWEPALGAEENPHRQAMEFYNKTPKADYDYRVMEIPLTEMMYPSAGVGYSRVETRSIHRDTVKNAAGISVTDFYTTREFPTTSSFTLLSEHNAEDRYESGALDKLLKTDLKTAVALSQGFKVDLNDMNGKMKKQSTYSPNNLNDPISYTENFYSMVKTGQNSFKLNHQFPVISGADGKIQQSLIGREIEIMTDFREHNLRTITTNINFNIDLIMAVYFPIPIPTTWKPVVKESTIYRSASVLKVVNHYSMLDSVVAVDKGSMVSTKNMVFDAETGDPLLTRTNNEQNKPLYNFSYPAHWAYSGMGLAYKNIDVQYNNVTFRNGKPDLSSEDLSFFESGDEIMVTSYQTPGPASMLPCDPLALPRSEAKKIWAIYTGKTGSLTPQWLFIDENGNPYSAANVSMRIIRSGKRNMFSSPLGSVVSLSNPVNPTNGQLEFNDNTSIIQTSAATYKDHWRVDNSFFLFDSVVKRNVYARVKCMRYDAVASAAVESHVNTQTGYIGDQTLTLDPYSVQANARSRKRGPDRDYSWVVDSWLNFNLRGAIIPANATIVTAKLNLYAHIQNNWPYPGVPAQNYTHNSWNGDYHNSGWAHGSVGESGAANDVGILRMTTPWPNNAGAWYNLFNDRNFNLHNWQSGGYIPPTPNYSPQSYLLLSSTNDRRVTIPNSVINAMFGDARNPNSNNATGFRIMQSRPASYYEKVNRGQTIGQCFMSNVQPTHSFGWSRPNLNIYYYVCGDTAFSSVCSDIMIRTAARSNDETGADVAQVSITDTLLNKLILCNIVDQRILECRSKFTQRKSVNPYVEGIWGNWRVDTTFVYYGDRKENTVIDGQPVDLRKGGTIINYKNFWNFAATNAQYLSRNMATSNVWVWNSAITQYNRKGYEIENKDPLERHNAGLYGYNQQLPVAVVNNSRYMESMYDGFEDYDYQSNSCGETCPPRRHVDMGNIKPLLDGSQKHSGLLSLKVNAGQTFSFSAPVVDTASLRRSYAMRVKVDSTSYSTTAVAPNGNGLRGKYLKFNKGGHTWLYYANNTLAAINSSPYTITRTDAQVNLGTSAGQLTPPQGWGSFVTRWEGFLLPRETGVHQFFIAYNDGMLMKIGGQTIADGWGTGNSGSATGSISLTRGVPVAITVEYWDGTPTGTAVLLWKEPQMAGFDLVPKSALYTPDRYNDALNAVTAANGWCTKLDSVNVRGNALTDTFSLIQYKKMLISAWVKVGGNDCRCSTYTGNKIRISYTGSSTVEEFTPAGSIIEGWQRYEGIFEIPASATKINVGLMNTGSATAWFDDLRIHPFNANMKSFVYHPQNLRLTGELDENNYASFYEYDDDGTLSRVKKETVNGVKTITETRSHLQKAVQ